MTRYLDYIRSIQQIDWDRIHFLDESHIVPRRLHKKRVFGLVNERTYITRNSLHSKTATITILTSVGPTSETILLDYTEQKNDQWSFFNFVHWACIRGSLKPGDFLVSDNAPIHGAENSYVALDILLDLYGVRLIFFPSYSPELNPCELVFNVLKGQIKNKRKEDLPIYQEVLKSLAVINEDMMMKFYRSCIFPKILLPDVIINQ